MLELRDATLEVGHEPQSQTLLHGVTLAFPAGHFAAIVGPSGCGKSTLLKVVAGLYEPTDGQVLWQKRDLSTDGDLAPTDIGYVPQFGIAYDLLTVHENVITALQLRVAGLDLDQQEARTNEILEQTGLTLIADRRVAVLSGGQKRRLALALELVSEPALLLCDEVTSGLDPKAEDEIVQLMQRLSRQNGRLVLSVTHSLRHLDLFDSIAVLFEGHVAYHGSPEFLLHYFSVATAEEVFPKLYTRDGPAWQQSWAKHGHEYYRVHLGDAGKSSDPVVVDDRVTGSVQPTVFEPLIGLDKDAALNSGVARRSAGPAIETPGFLTQFRVAFTRRLRIFFRNRSELLLQAALLFGFPCLVVIFAWDGLPQIEKLSMSITDNPVGQLLEANRHLIQSAKIGGLVSGLVMFQVILLTLMGSNNAAREIAAERLIFEKEKLAGVSPASYLASKLAFLALLVAAQSFWMAAFVHRICRFPGDLSSQALILFLVDAAMTSICLGISSMAKTPEQASLLSIYLVGFQLPLSGAVLALPETLGNITRPMIASYWGWSGYLQTMRDTAFYDVVTQTAQTKLSSPGLCSWVLWCHVLLGILLAYFGCRHSRWER